MKDLDMKALNEISYVLTGKNDAPAVEAALFNFFLENCITIGKNAYVLPMQLEQLTRSPHLERISRKLNASMAMELVKNEVEGGIGKLDAVVKEQR